MKITEADLKAAFVAGANWKAWMHRDKIPLALSAQITDSEWHTDIDKAFVQHIGARAGYRAAIKMLKRST